MTGKINFKELSISELKLLQRYIEEEIERLYDKLYELEEYEEEDAEKEAEFFSRNAEK
jgi:hypothetical protein